MVLWRFDKGQGTHPHRQEEGSVVRFLHTSDWQLGMRRNYLSETAQSRFTDERIAAVKRINELAVSESCAFVIVAGDVFETNQPDRETLIRAFDAMRSDEIVFYLLPGNHDPLEPGSVYRSTSFQANCPPNVKVLDRPGIFVLTENIEIVAVPLTSKRPLSDSIADTCSSLVPDARIARVCVAHGQVDEIMSIVDNPALFSLNAAEELINSGCLAYIALGDSHSVSNIGTTDRIRYSGTPVATRRTEPKPNYALIVDVSNDKCQVVEHEVGNWHFVSDSRRLDTTEDVDSLATWLEEINDKESTVLRLELEGVLSLENYDKLKTILEDSDLLFAALRMPESGQDLLIEPSEADFEGLQLTGFARGAFEDLSAKVRAGGDDAQIATDALALLYRFAHGEE